MNYYVYLLRCADNSLYCGITNNLEKRLKEHNSESSKGAKYLRTRRPVTIVYTEEQPDRSSALKREYAIKQLSKQEKENLILKAT